MKAFVEVIGTGSVELAPSLLFFFDDKRYLFNCGEGMQRFCAQHKVRLNKIQNIFLTRCSWEELGGLPGTLLTIADVTCGAQKHVTMSLHGPAELVPMLYATRYFLVKSKLTLEISTNDFCSAARCHPSDSSSPSSSSRLTKANEDEEGNGESHGVIHQDDNIEVFATTIRHNNDPKSIPRRQRKEGRDVQTGEEEISKENTEFRDIQNRDIVHYAHSPIYYEEQPRWVYVAGKSANEHVLHLTLGKKEKKSWDERGDVLQNAQAARKAQAMRKRKRKEDMITVRELKKHNLT